MSEYTPDLNPSPLNLAALNARLPRRGDRSALAKSLGWHRSRLSMYLTGQRTPKVGAMQDLARALGCTVDDLLR